MQAAKYKRSEIDVVLSIYRESPDLQNRNLSNNILTKEVDYNFIVGNEKTDDWWVSCQEFVPAVDSRVMVYLYDEETQRYVVDEKRYDHAGFFNTEKGFCLIAKFGGLRPVAGKFWKCLPGENCVAFSVSLVNIAKNLIAPYQATRQFRKKLE